MTVHRIRLSAAWERPAAADARRTSRAPATRISLPVRIDSDPDCLGELCLRRRFHRPTGLTDAAVVSLQFICDPVPGTIRLNAQIRSDISLRPVSVEEFRGALGDDPDVEFATSRAQILCLDVSRQLEPFNDIELVWSRQSGSGAPGPLIAAWLEIRDAAT